MDTSGFAASASEVTCRITTRASHPFQNPGYHAMITVIIQP